MASTMIVRLQQATSSVEAAEQAHSGETAPVIEARLSPFLPEGQTMPSFALVMHLLGSLMRWSRQRLVEIDKAKIDEITDDAEGRFERDAAVEEVRSILIRGRRICEGLFGPERSAALFPIDGKTAVLPEFLWRQGEHTVTRLRNPQLALPDQATDSTQFDPLTFADELEPAVLRLRTAVDALELVRREAESTLGVKTEVITEHKLILRACTRILAGFFLLADRRDLAERVRPSVRRRRPPADDEDGGEESPASQSSAEPLAETADGEGSIPEPVPSSSPAAEG